MILDARAGLRGLLIDLDAGKPIRHARWADLDTGEYECLRAGPDGRPARGPDGRPLVYRGRARLQFIPTAPAGPRPRPAGAADGPDPRDLPPPVIALPGWECEERGCHRPGVYETADEQVVEPHVGPDGRACERARVVRRHRWCEWHYRPPVSTSARGVESEVEVTVRPQ